MTTQTNDISPLHKFRDFFDDLHCEVSDISALIAGMDALLENGPSSDYNSPAAEGPRSLRRMAEEKLEALGADLHTLWNMHLALERAPASGSNGVSEVMENFLLYKRKQVEVGSESTTDPVLEKLTDDLTELEKLVIAAPTTSERDLIAKLLVASGEGIFDPQDDAWDSIIADAKRLMA